MSASCLRLQCRIFLDVLPNTQEYTMTESWKRWEGQVADGQFHLRQYLGGSDHSAVFQTERDSQKAAIKLIAADPDSAETQLSRWRQAAKLSHPHLLQIFQMGRCQLGDMNLLYVVMECARKIFRKFSRSAR